MAKTQFNNIEKKLSSGGPSTPPLDMNEFIKLADLEFDIELSIMESLKEEFKKEAPPGTSFLDWLKSKDDDFFKRIKLSNGGKVSKAKIKEPKSVQRIDLTAEFLKTTDMLSKLTDAERQSISMLLNKLLNPRD